MIRLQDTFMDGNGNTSMSFVAVNEEQQTTSTDEKVLDSIRSSASTCGLTCSSTSDSGCMIESYSSSTTIDDDHKIFDDVSCNNNNKNNGNSSVNKQPSSMYSLMGKY
ncbi:unnamed protein product [Thelazia callipaeda]|uniref:Myb-like protein D n=1 Tax=Thelazia callipaeda TaxID=103827 RepID=A0A0N5CPE4_THECL|nr:unnamed protein product [Thelazia callipaeda]